MAVGVAHQEPARRAALVPTARFLLVVNELLFVYWAWFFLPLDASTPTLIHLRLSGGAFLSLSALSVAVFGGWKAVCLAIRWRVDGSLIWAWSLLGVYAAYGALWGIVIGEALSR